jgi:hypothetical protein
MSKHDIDIMIIKTKTGQQNCDYKDIIACAVVNKTEHRYKHRALFKYFHIQG